MIEFKYFVFVSFLLLTMSGVKAAKNTTILLQRLRALMKNTSVVNPTINAYIVPSGDAHLSEYIAPCDARRAFISGFTGSYGVAIITESKAAMWTDGRYFIQAAEQMDENWTLMKGSLPSTPSQDKWLDTELPPNGKVGVDPYLMSQGGWQDMSEKLKANGHSLVPIQSNLIDAIWEDRPPRPLDKVLVHKLEFAGVSWQNKISLMRTKMERGHATALVVSALDDVAWLLNLRGSDIPFNPVFFSYLVVTDDSILFFIDETKLSEDVKRHLNTSSSVGNEMKVIIRPYDQVINDLRTIVQNANGKIWLPPSTNQAISEVVPTTRRLSEHSPVAVAKTVKNEIELRGMRNCHIRDAVALCEFFSWFEKEVPARNVTEIEAADYAEACRRKQANFVSLSFDTISSTGPNGAIIHYKPTEESNKVISPNELYLIDSGAQYLDGTTDITRTVHLGTPSDYEKECFTAVLKGHISLDAAVFPNDVKGLLLDSLARQHLWKLGLDYRHGTGHGVGSFLNVHEGPIGISPKHRPEDIFLKKGMILSNEPGYYEDGKFGIRIENLFVIEEAQTKYNYQEVGFLTCNMISLVPIQTKMIKKSSMTQDEIKWVNDYNVKCREVVGAEIQRQGFEDAYQWLLRETVPL